MVALMGLLLSLAAHADPLALRLAPPGAAAGLVAGWPESSAAVWSAREGWGLSVSARLPSGAVELAAGRRTRHTTSPQGTARGWEIGAAGGLLLAPLYAPPALAVTATPYARRWRGAGTGERTLGVAVPGALRVTHGVEARLPLLLEGTAGRPLGPVWGGVYLGGGVVLSPGQGGWALGGQAGLIVQPHVR